MRSFLFSSERLLAISLVLLSTALSSNLVSAANSTAPQTGPVDPKDDPHNPLKYITNNTLTTIGLVLTVAIAIAHTWLIVKTRARYMLVIVIAECCYAIGIASRYGLHYNPDSRGIYIFEYLFVTLAPCGYVAAEYVILGRLVHWLNGDKHLLIRPTLVTKVFVASDVVTFLIQAGGGSIAVSSRTDINKVHLGQHLFLLGLVLQLISFTFFTLMLLHFLFRMKTYEAQTWGRDNLYRLAWHKDWRAFAAAIVASCIGVLVRSAYRTIEIADGGNGTLTTHEIYFWVLDFVPLFIAVALYIPFWPGRFIDRDELPPKTYRLDSQVTLTPGHNESSTSIPLYASNKRFQSQTNL